jgi:hypothetical protein
MKVYSITISLAELQEALRDYAEKHAIAQPTAVYIESFDKVRLSVELIPNGLVESFGEFKHRIH